MKNRAAPSGSRGSRFIPGHAVAGRVAMRRPRRASRNVRRYGVDVSDRGIKGEAHFGWVLEGRAVQDVWMLPRLSDRTAGLEKSLNSYGTTLRVWDPAIQAWHVTWINHVTGRRDELIGRWSGKDIVQIGAHSDGTPIRWIFSEITHDSFRWTGEVLEPDGKTWKLEGEFLARRASSSNPLFK